MNFVSARAHALQACQVELYMADTRLSFWRILAGEAKRCDRFAIAASKNDIVALFQELLCYLQPYSRTATYTDKQIVGLKQYLSGRWQEVNQ